MRLKKITTKLSTILHLLVEPITSLAKKSFYGLIGWFDKNISGFQETILGGWRNQNQEFDLIIEVIKWGVVAEESDVGSIFWGDGYLIKMTDSFLRKVLILEKVEGMKD